MDLSVRACEHSITRDRALHKGQTVRELCRFFMGRVAMLLQRRPDGNSRLIEAVHVQIHQPNGESLFLRATFNMPGPGVATHGMVWYGMV